MFLLSAPYEKPTAALFLSLSQSLSHIHTNTHRPGAHTHADIHTYTHTDTQPTTHVLLMILARSLSWLCLQATSTATSLLNVVLAHSDKKKGKDIIRRLLKAKEVYSIFYCYY